jgi:hypothetical protein
VRRRTARELTALADGTLPPERCESLLRRVSASPKLARALEQQVIAIQAVRRLETSAPAELRERIQRALRKARAAERRRPPTE